jgi:hypothetical protein
MRVFYWTEPFADMPARFYQADSEENWAAEVSPQGVTKEAIVEMIDNGHIEISATTAYKLGLPT